MARWTLRFWRGYLELAVSGGAPHRFVNGLLARGIDVWNLHWHGPVLRLCLAWRDFALIRPAVRGSGCHVRIVRRRGLRTILGSVVRRQGLLLGLAAVVIAIQVITALIWRIEVTGLNRVPREALLQTAAGAGLRLKAVRRSVDMDAVREALLIAHPELAWVGIRLHGTLVIIDAVEKATALPIEDQSPGDIVAAVPAVIEKILPVIGEGWAQPGQEVAAGDILIAGRMYVDGYARKAVRARGVVLGRVYQLEQASHPLTVAERIRTGTQQTVLVFRVGSRVILVGKPLFSPEERDDQVVGHWVFSRSKYATVELTKVRYHHVEVRQQTWSPQDARELAKAAALEALRARLPAGAVIAAARFTDVVDAEVVRVELDAWVTMEIGEFRRH